MFITPQSSLCCEDRLVFLKDNRAPWPLEAGIFSRRKTEDRTYYHSRFTDLETEDKGSKSPFFQTHLYRQVLIQSCAENSQSILKSVRFVQALYFLRWNLHWKT